MDKKEYRILEHQGLFYVQIKHSQILKNEKAENWVRIANIFSVILFPITIYLFIRDWLDIPTVNTEWKSCTIDFPPTYFKTLDEAKAKIVLLTKPDKVHYIATLYDETQTIARVNFDNLKKQ